MLSKAEIRQAEIDPEEILQKVDILGKTDWNSTKLQEAYNLICEYAYIFSWNDLDLSKTSIVKHSTKLTDPTLFKECYICTPPRMYEVVTSLDLKLGYWQVEMEEDCKALIAFLSVP